MARTKEQGRLHSAARRAAWTPEEHAENLRYQRARHLKMNYGLSVGQFWSMVCAQGGRCPGCDQPLDLSMTALDHCHKTGRPRGVMCRPCNSGMGQLGDDPARLRRAADYLDRFKEQTS